MNHYRPKHPSTELPDPPIPGALPTGMGSPLRRWEDHARYLRPRSKVAKEHRPPLALEVACAVLAALAIILAQFFHGGAMRPALALPALGLLGVAGVLGFRYLGRMSLCRAWVVTLAGWLLFVTWLMPASWSSGANLRITLGALLLYLLMANVITRSRVRVAFVILLLTAAMIQSFLGWAQLYGGGTLPLGWHSEQLRVWYEGRMGVRAHGTYINPNHLAWMLNGVGLFSLALGLDAPRNRWFFLLGAGVAFAGAFLTLSRGGMIGLGVALAVMAVLRLAGRANRWRVALLVFIPLAMFWAIWQLHPPLQTRVERLVDDPYRVELWQVAKEQVWAHPWLGSGPGSFTYFARQRRGDGDGQEDYHAHNDWLQTAAEYGIPALLLLLGVGVVHLWAGGRIWRASSRPAVTQRLHQSYRGPVALGALAVAVMFAVQMTFDFNLQIPANALLAAAVAGMLASRLELHKPPGWLPGLAGAALMFMFILSLKSGWGDYVALDAENRLLRGEQEAAYLRARQGISSAPEHPRLHRLAGDALIAQARVETDPAAIRLSLKEAEAAFRRAISLDPRDRGHYIRLAEALAAQRFGEEALEALNKAISLAPTQRRPYELAGQIHEMMGQEAQAIASYQHAATRASKERLKAILQRQKARKPATKTEPSLTSPRPKQ